MSRILLLNPPGDRLYLRDQHCCSVSKASYCWPPVDLIMLSGIVSSGKNEAGVIDAIVERIDENACLKRIIEFKPDAVIFLTGISSWLRDFSFMEKAKRATEARIIASGGFLLHECERVMEKFDFLDAVIMDYSSGSILSYLDGNEESVTDMCVRRNNKVIRMPSSNLGEFSIPVPRHDLFPLSKYRLPHNRLSPFTCVLTNYGCPFSCGFCVAGNINFKYRPVENIIPEIESIVASEIREIFFRDFTFGMPKKISELLCEEIAARFPKLSWICSTRVNAVDERMLKLMKKAGCHTIQFGVESSSQKILDGSGKKIEVSETRSVFNSCRRMGIRTLAHFILGLPGETEESLLQTVEFAKEIRCDYASFNIAIPLPGTRLRETCEENHWIASNLDELDSSRGYPVIETPELSREKLWDLRNRAIRSYYLRPSYVAGKLMGIKSPRDLISLFREGFGLLSAIRR